MHRANHQQDRHPRAWREDDDRGCGDGRRKRRRQQQHAESEGLMFTNFFLELRAAGVPTSIKEYLALLEAMKANVAPFDVEDFYYLSRAVLVKDERHLDRFDVVFGTVFKGLEKTEDDEVTADIPEEWLRKLAEKFLSPEEMAKLKAMNWQELMETLKKRLEGQK